MSILPLKSYSDCSSPNITNNSEQKKCCSFICNALPIFHPYRAARLCWDAFIMLTLIYTAIEIPLTLAFEVKLSLTNTLGRLAFCVDILLLIDICINFRTGYYDKWDRLLLHLDPYDIAKKYFKSWFFLDLITSFPVEFIVNTGATRENNLSAYIKVLRIFRLFRMLKMLRVIRVIRIFDGLTKMMDIAREMFFVMRFSKILGAMILTAHYFACIWWHVGLTGYKNEGKTSWIEAQGIDINDPLMVKYSASWYWAVVTLFTTGYGDITAHNPTEQWVCSVCILTGSCLFAYFIGTLTTWVAEGDRVRTFEMQKVEEAQAFCRHHKFDRELTRTILTHVRYHCNYNFVFDNEEILPLLPPFLQRKVNQSVAIRSLNKMDLFKDLPAEVIGQIALTMDSISCNAETYLFERGHIAKCMYLQRTGAARLKYFDGTPPRKLERGDVIGERALIAGKRRYNVICTRWSEFYVLNIENIRDIFRRSFKPKRFKYEWNLIKKKVKMSDTKNIKSQRRCNLPTNKSEKVSRQVIHQISVKGKTLRSEIIDKFMRTPKKPAVVSEGYQKVSQKDIDENSDVLPKNKFMKSCALDMDDINSSNIQLIDIAKPDTTYQSEFINDNSSQKAYSFVISNNNSKKSSESTETNDGISNKRSGSSSFFHMPWLARHNSERRNEKVKTHTEKTAYGKKGTPLCVKNDMSNETKMENKNVFQFNSVSYNSDEELDLDYSEDSDDLLAPLTTTATKRRRFVGSSNRKCLGGRFGHNKNRTRSKRHLTLLPTPETIILTKSKTNSINEIEIVEDIESNNSEEKENDTLVLNKQIDKSTKQLLGLSKIKQSVARNCSYEKAVRTGSYSIPSGSSSSDNDTQQQKQNNNQNGQKDSKQT